MNYSKHAASGFTLIELMLAIAIMAALSAGVYFFYSNVQNRANVTSTQNSLAMIKSAIDSYEVDKQEYPAKLSDLAPLYMSKLSKDVWKNDFKYRPTPNAQYPYELYSYGPNGPGSSKDEHISVRR